MRMYQDPIATGTYERDTTVDTWPTPDGFRQITRTTKDTFYIPASAPPGTLHQTDVTFVRGQAVRSRMEILTDRTDARTRGGLEAGIRARMTRPYGAYELQVVPGAVSNGPPLSAYFGISTIIGAGPGNTVVSEDTAFPGTTDFNGRPALIFTFSQHFRLDNVAGRETKISGYANVDRETGYPLFNLRDIRSFDNGIEVQRSIITESCEIAPLSGSPPPVTP